MRPGTWLLKIAPFLFSERFVAAVVRPTIADLQAECATAASDRRTRLRIRWRGYATFWTLLIMAPFSRWSDDVPGMPAERLAAMSALVALATVVTVGAWIGLVFAAGALIAFFIHAWYRRHPSELAMPPDPPWRSPQINFSSTEVGGNIGGLIFALGSVLIVALGIPAGLWFLVAGAIGACFVAWALVAWHARGQEEAWRVAGGRPRRRF
jgi:hypothetical protein